MQVKFICENRSFNYGELKLIPRIGDLVYINEVGMEYEVVSIVWDYHLESIFINLA